MRRRMVTAVAAGVAGLALSLVAGAGWASPPYGVSVAGDSSPGLVPFSNALGSVSWTIDDATTGTPVTYGCTGVTVSGTVTTGPSNINPYLGFTASSFSGCTGLGGAQVITQSSTAFLYGTTPATLPLVDDIVGYVGNVGLHVATSPLSAICNYDITGFIAADFDEPTQTLTLDEAGYTGDLALANVHGCLGALHDGDPVDVTLSFSPGVTGGGPINLFN